MFGSSKKPEEVKKSPTTTSSASSNALNTLVKGTSVEGTIKCENDLRIDGKIKGKLNCNAKVIIGPTGEVEGEIRCQNAVIEGTFRGILHVAELLNVRDTASLEGEIFTNKLIVQSGANFNVACKMDAGLSNGTAKMPDLKNQSAHGSVATAIAGGKAQVSN